MKWGDIVLSKDPETGCELLLRKAERGSKTRHGDGQHQRAFYPKAQATENERCPVKLYQAFSKHRPLEMKQPDSPFFLAINHRRQSSSQIWYSKAALGKNEIGKFLSKAAKAAGLPGNITNHSVRKTCISRLMDANIPENFVAQLSGHKDLKSLDSYESASTAHQRKMSLVLSRSAISTSATSSNESKQNTEAFKNNVEQNLAYSNSVPTVRQCKACSQERQFRRSKAVISTFSSTRVRAQSDKQLFPKEDVLS